METAAQSTELYAALPLYSTNAVQNFLFKHLEAEKCQHFQGCMHRHTDTRHSILALVMTWWSSSQSYTSFDYSGLLLLLAPAAAWNDRPEASMMSDWSLNDFTHSTSEKLFFFRVTVWYCCVRLHGSFFTAYFVLRISVYYYYYYYYCTNRTQQVHESQAMRLKSDTHWTAPRPAHDGNWISFRLSWLSTMSAKSCLTATVASRMRTCPEKQLTKLSTIELVISNTQQHNTNTADHTQQHSPPTYTLLTFACMCTHTHIHTHKHCVGNFIPVKYIQCHRT